MKAHFTMKNCPIRFEVEGQSHKELFRAIAELQNVFEADWTCGCCHRSGLFLRVRTVGENDYYEMVCYECRAVLSFGQTKKGNSLFPKRKDSDGKMLPNRGWKIWKPAGEEPAHMEAAK